ncbi:MAG: hypothetical protein A2289_16955 [Deltaproteobacteria bacterium RIFOXYA12_FULL_58_15]|nr:MAG: hypothetical protein A2289_16955 [Deltaproteobacteria bacterium RIFOXYA12_FULL_58_15]OGR09960.1 MAG: hypothetical protein A2341_12370 [Deltaproteobacteria bacterium RIFOXYB12_FULL_58_9]
MRPEQSGYRGPATIDIFYDELRFTIKPLYEYELSGLVVAKTDYTLFADNDVAAVVPVDLCIVWGTNLERGIHNHPSTDFWQRMRWCYWQSEVPIDATEIANNHLVVNDERIRDALTDLSLGDQVRLRGQLIELWAHTPAGEQRKAYASSTSRDDTRGGACEVIYVREAELLRRGNPISYWTHRIGLWSLGLWSCTWLVLRLVRRG